MKSLYSILLVSALSVTAVFSQQEAQFTQFMYNKMLINPAFASAREVPSIMALYRNQWLGFEGAPRTQLVSFDSPLFSKRVGFGLSLALQQTGIINNWYANMAYSYSIVRTENVAFRLGLQGTLRYYDINFADPKNYIRDNPYQDKSIQYNERVRQLKGNVGLGMYFDYKEFYFGASVPNLYRNIIGINDDPNIIVAQETPHFYITSGMVLPLTNSVWLKPSVMAKIVKNAPFDLDANVSFVFNRRFQVGVSYRLDDSFDMTTFFQITDQLGFGAAYDFTTSKLAGYNNGSLEVMLRYDFRKSPKEGKGKNDANDLSNPRFFF